MVAGGDTMRRRLVTVVAVAVCLYGAAAAAHHSFAATYIQSQTMKIEGKVAQFVFRNPHSFVHVMAPDDKGEMVRWAVEWQGGAQLGNSGITVNTIKSGDPVVITGNPGRTASEHRIRMVTLLRTSDGLNWGNREGQVVD